MKKLLKKAKKFLRYKVLLGLTHFSKIYTDSYLCDDTDNTVYFFFGIGNIHIAKDLQGKLVFWKILIYLTGFLTLYIYYFNRKIGITFKKEVYY